MSLGILESRRVRRRKAMAGAALGASQIPWQCWDKPGFKDCHAEAYALAARDCHERGKVDDFGGNMPECVERLTDRYTMEGAGWFSGLANGCMHICPEQKATAQQRIEPLAPTPSCVAGIHSDMGWGFGYKWWAIWSPRNHRWCGPIRKNSLTDYWLREFRRRHDPGARLFYYTNYQWKEASG